MSNSMGVVKAISTRLWPRSPVGCPSNTFTIFPNVCLLFTITSIRFTNGERKAQNKRPGRLLESSYHEGWAHIVGRLWGTVRNCQGKYSSPPKIRYQAATSKVTLRLLPKLYFRRRDVKR